MIPPLIRLYGLLFLCSFHVFAEPQPNLSNVSLEEVQEMLGLETIKLKASFLNNEQVNFATRFNLTPLLQQRSAYFTHLSHVEISQLKRKQTQAEVKRLKKLANNQAVSSRKLLTQQNQLAIYSAELKAAKNKLNSLNSQFMSQWGGTLTNWFLANNNEYFQQLNAFKKYIYVLYLPNHLLTAPETIFIYPSNQRSQAKKAQLISNAPSFDSAQQAGNAFFYLAEPTKPLSRRVNAWVPLNTEPKSGVIIPQSALVWHLGQSFVYLQLDDKNFKRIKISHPIRIDPDHYFIQQKLQSNDRLVSLGAQTLLSEEFRGQIPAEDDDDDDDD